MSLRTLPPPVQVEVYPLGSLEVVIPYQIQDEIDLEVAGKTIKKYDTVREHKMLRLTAQDTGPFTIGTAQSIRWQQTTHEESLYWNQAYVRMTVAITFGSLNAFTIFPGGFAGMFKSIVARINSTTIEESSTKREILLQMRLILEKYRVEEAKFGRFGLTTNSADYDDTLTAIGALGSVSEKVASKQFTMTSLIQTYTREIEIPLSHLIDFFRTMKAPIYGADMEIEAFFQSSIDFLFTGVAGAITSVVISNAIMEVPHIELTPQADAKLKASIATLPRHFSSGQPTLLIDADMWYLHCFDFLPSGSTSFCRDHDTRGWVPLQVYVFAKPQLGTTQEVDKRDFNGLATLTNLTLNINNIAYDARKYNELNLVGGSVTPYHDLMDTILPTRRGGHAPSSLITLNDFAGIKGVYVFDLQRTHKRSSLLNRRNHLTWNGTFSGALANNTDLYVLIKYQRIYEVHYGDSRVEVMSAAL
jgi:hypothetical protein